ncbi:MAG: TonB-dependent receptor [Bacteroidales bacterium]
MSFLSSQTLKRLITVLCFVALGIGLFAQDVNKTKFSIRENNTSIKKVLEQVERTYKIRLFYDEKNLNVNIVKNINVKDVSFQELLNVMFDGDVTYTLSENGLVTLTKEIIQQASSDKLKIGGKVTDKAGEPLSGVYVYVKGANKGTYTDNNGSFLLENVIPNSNITFDYIGMKPQALHVAVSKNVNVILEEDAVVLEDVIITGYGSFKKSAYAGSASTIKTEGVKDVPAMSVSSMLQANAPGVSVTGDSGQPGAAPSIRIRGMGSFNASNSPLYVIDGVPVMSGDISNSGSRAGTDMMATINPSDIENVTVIKDAAAASLYGSRAANGVILITTKSGKKGKPQFNFKSDWGVSDFAYRYRPSMQGDERRDFIYDAMKRKILYDSKTPGTEAEAIAYANANIDEVAAKPWCGWVDWEDILMRNGFHQNYEFSVSGGADKFTYYSSFSFTDQEGVQHQQALSRLTGRLNVKYDANKWLQLGANVLFSDMNQDIGSDGMEYTSPLYSSKHKLTSSDAVYNEDGTYNENLQSNGSRNPKASLDHDYDKQRVTRTFSTAYAQIKFFEDLKLKTTFSYDFTMSKAKEWSDPRTSSGAASNGTAYKSYYDYNQLVWSTNLNYVKTIGKNHHLDALIAYEVSDYKRDYLSGSQANFANPDYNAIGNGAVPKSIGGAGSGNRLISYVSKLNYDYKNKYYIGASYRLDGSSRLYRESRWGSFWSVSGAWRFSEEGFFNGLKEIFPDAKLRVSYGVNGTLPSSYYAYMNLTSLTPSYNNEVGIAESVIAKQDLQWENNYTTNVGLDLNIKNAVNLTFEYYSRTTKNLLMDMPISLGTGFDSYMTNIGKVRNNGVELTVNSTNFDRKNFSWTTSFNIGHNKNKILVLDGVQNEIVSGTQIRRVGMPYYTYYMIEFAGINPETGKPQFYTNDIDENGNYVKEITEKTSKANPIADKSPFPTVSMGLTNTFRYKFIDLGFTLSSTLGGWSYDNAAQKSQTSGSGDGAINQIPVYYRDSWKKPGDETIYEAWIYGNTSKMSSPANSRRLHSTNHLRVKNFTLGVTMPKGWTQKVGINKLRLYFSAYNMLTWAAFNEYDPEVPVSGSVGYNTPPLRTLTFGLDINF